MLGRNLHGWQQQCMAAAVHMLADQKAESEVGIRGSNASKDAFLS